jgi:phosphoribosylglycinamide formyltransferase-1
VSVRVAVFASGGGSNLQALIDHFAHASEASISLVISDRADAGALRRAADAGVPAHHIETRERGIDQVAEETLQVLADNNVELVALAGYLKLVPPAVTREYRDRIINIHPALLPAFGGRGMYGMRVHEAVIRAGCRVSGVTVHHVDERYDEGAIIAQWPVPVLPGDSPQSLAARVLRTEHRLYPVAVAAIASARRGGSPAARDFDGFRMMAQLDGVEHEMRLLAGLE